MIVIFEDHVIWEFTKQDMIWEFKKQDNYVIVYISDLMCDTP